jgi:hypothetical protein
MPCKIRGLEEAHSSPKKQAILRFGTFTAADQVAPRSSLFKRRLPCGGDGNPASVEGDAAANSSRLHMPGL